jgi:hypothetical protein
MYDSGLQHIPQTIMTLRNTYTHIHAQRYRQAYGKPRKRFCIPPVRKHGRHQILCNCTDIVNHFITYVNYIISLTHLDF